MLQVHPKNNEGAFLIIALILLIVLSALGVASMTLALTANRVSQNYSDYLEAKAKADSMANYAKRILETYTAREYPTPGTCTSSGTCNVIDNNFPHSGRPILAWNSGLDTDNLNQHAGRDAWWNTNGFAYEETFGGSGNARVIVSVVGTDTTYPFTRTFRIVGYATDSTGTTSATSEHYLSMDTFPPDPGDGTCTGTAPANCYYGQCCNSSNICATSQTDCESGSSAITPPGWTCVDYFQTGLGYGAATCTNQDAITTSAYNLIQQDFQAIEDYLDANGCLPAIPSPDFTMTGEGSYLETANYVLFNYEGQWGLTAEFYEQNIPGNTMPGSIVNKIYLRPFPNPSGSGYIWECSVFDSQTATHLPFDCTYTTAPNYSECP